MYKELETVVKLLQPERYLEIGVGKGGTLNSVPCSYKVGIDPKPQTPPDFKYKIYKVPSNFVFISPTFCQNEWDGFDLIFIDGFHEFKQVVDDINNSLMFLNPGGIIVVHDVYPFEHKDAFKMISEMPPLDCEQWTGDVWKSIFYVKYRLLNTNYFVVKNFPGYMYIYKTTSPRVKDFREISIDEIKQLKPQYLFDNEKSIKFVTLNQLIQELANDKDIDTCVAHPHQYELLI